MTISAEVQNWQIMNWRIDSPGGWLESPDSYGEVVSNYQRYFSHSAEERGFERAPLETLISQIDADIQ